MRHDNRNNNELRPIKILRNYTKYAEGSVLIECGGTKVVCTATIENELPQFLKNKKTGWVSAEYAMLPRATHTRNKRESVMGKISPRSSEISRLIGRSLRACIDLEALGERQILIDCDVIQADGGTRTTSITGAFIAMYDAVTHLVNTGDLVKSPIKQFMAAISVGVYQGTALLDLDYIEDSKCDTDMNIVMLEDKSIIEIQGTAEGTPLSRALMNQLIDLSETGIMRLIQIQKDAII